MEMINEKNMNSELDEKKKCMSSVARRAAFAAMAFGALMLAPSKADAQTNMADPTSDHRYSGAHFFKIAKDSPASDLKVASIPLIKGISASIAMFSNSKTETRTQTTSVVGKVGPVDAAAIMVKQSGPGTDRRPVQFGTLDLKLPSNFAVSAYANLKETGDVKLGARRTMGRFTAFASATLTEGKMESSNGRMNAAVGLKIDTPIVGANLAFVNASEKTSLRVFKSVNKKFGAIVPEIGIEKQKGSLPSYRLALSLIVK